MKQPSIVTCYNCQVSEYADYMVLTDLGNGKIEYVHPLAEGRCKPITFTDGTPILFHEDGIIDLEDETLLRAGRVASIKVCRAARHRP